MENEIVNPEMEPAAPSKVMTYFVQAEVGGPIKIGISAKPKARLSGLQTGHPHKLRILLILPGNREAELHERFHEHRISGEWFRDADEIYQFIKQEHGLNPRRKRCDPYEGMELKSNLVERYCDEVFTGQEELESLLFDLGDMKGTPGDEDCRVCRIIDRMEARRGMPLEQVKRKTSREEYVLSLLCGCPYDCTDNCDSDRWSWLHAIANIAACETILEAVGINIENRELWVLTKPLTSRRRHVEYFDYLPGAAGWLDDVAWGLFGNAPDDAEQIIDFWKLDLCIREEVSDAIAESLCISKPGQQ